MTDVLTGSAISVWSIVVSGVSASHHRLMMMLVVGLKVMWRIVDKTCKT